jgi:hypothetical protein
MTCSAHSIKFELINGVYHVDGLPVAESRAALRRYLNAAGRSVVYLTGCCELLNWPDVAFVIVPDGVKTVAHMRDGRILKEGRFI